MTKEDIKKEREDFFKQIEELENKQKEVVKKEKKIVEKKEKHAEYFEGQIQMRGITREILDYVQKRIEEEGENVPTVVTHGRNDIDYYLSSKKLIHRLGIELKDKFGGFVKESAQLFSKNNLTSKNIYRLNLYYKTHDIEKGQVVAIEDLNEPYKVRGYLGERLIVESLVSTKRSHIDIDKVKQKIDKIKTTIVQVHPQIIAMDENYQPVEIITSKDEKIVEGQNIKIIKFDGKYYLA